MKTTSFPYAVLMVLALTAAVTGDSRAAVPLLLADVSLDEAARRIMNTQRVRVLSAKTKVVNGRKVHVFRVLTPDGRIQHIKVDASTGAIMGRKGS